ncbi:MAG: glycosyltransferase family 2 protein, partial [Magnetospirillum sp.]|nr:glycosyltransferase family 2 protein [Magnetospirillum sp.]
MALTTPALFFTLPASLDKAAHMSNQIHQITRPVLSLVVPMFNEADNVDRLFARLAEVMAGLGVTYEIVCVDDGSRDDTVARAVDHHGRDPRIKVVELSRNFGKELALTAGLQHTSGQAVIMIDADLQHPPELIGEMLEKWRQGFEMV